MVKMNPNTLIGLVIALLLTAILLPLGINTIYSNQIELSETTSLSNADRVEMLLNGTDVGLWNGSVIEPSFTNYTDIIINLTLTHSVNYTISFTVGNTNASANTVYKCDLIFNVDLVTYAFNSTDGLNETFAFNTTYTKVVPTEITSIYLRMYSIVTTNNTISFTGSVEEVYTTETTELLNTMYLIIPIIAVIGVVMGFIKKKV